MVYGTVQQEKNYFKIITSKTICQIIFIRKPKVKHIKQKWNL